MNSTFVHREKPFGFCKVALMSNNIVLNNYPKQPRILYLICFTEMLERFSYYTLRAILVLYMTKELLFTPDHSYGVFAGFSALLYLAPFVGGLLSDKILGKKLAIILGGILLTIGYALLGIPAGSGFFIPNIAGIVGELYDNYAASRDGGFSIFYAAINLGALLPPLLIYLIIQKLGWCAGFEIAAFSVLTGVIIFYLSLRQFPELGKPPLSNFSLLKFCLMILAGALFLIPMFSELMRNPALVNTIVLIIGTGFLLYAFRESFKFPQWQCSQLHVCFFLTLFSIVFEILLQQTAMSITTFVEVGVRRNFGFWEIPTVMFQALNPFFIVMLAPLFSKIWQWLDKKNYNPSIPAKFAFGTFLMGVGFLIFPIIIHLSATVQISFLWIVVSYFFQSCGELLVSPVGLAMITQLSPKPMAGMMMGAWCFAIAIANSLAGVISQQSTVHYSKNSVLLPAQTYSFVFGELGALAIISSVLIFAMIPKLKKIILHTEYEKEIIDHATPSFSLSSS
jgi:POT family proton-dependent oligopeptide transporter